MLLTFAARGEYSIPDQVRVLVAEDDSASRYTLNKVLELLGCKIVSVGTVGEAMRNLNGHTHVLLDLMFPDGTGVEVLRHIRSNHPGVKVALITAAGRGSKVLSDAMAHEPDIVLHKPLELGDLIRWLNETAG
jgi:CheY-like chemotaxis protein